MLDAADDADVVGEPETFLWVAAIALYGVGDLVTTGAGFLTGHVAEAGPLPSVLAVEFGFAGVVSLKVAAFAVSLVVWRLAPDPHRVGVPLAFTVVGAVVTTWNTLVLASAWL